MDAGNLKWIARIESPPTGKTATGATSATNAWTHVCSRRCKVEGTSGTKAEQGAEKPTSIAWYTVVMRYTPSVLPKCRLVIKGRPFTGITMRVEAVRHSATETSLTCVVVK